MTLNGGTEITTLSGLIDLMREKGVASLHFKVEGFEVDLSLGVQPKIDVDDVPNIDSKPKRGKDGLSAAEQFDLYGRVIDAE